MIPTYWLAEAVGVAPDEDSSVIFDNPDAAVAAAKSAAKADGRPYAVYKLVQTHYIKAPRDAFSLPPGVELVQA